MYKQVSTKDLLSEFHRIKKDSWDGEGYEMEYAKENSDLFLFYPEVNEEEAEGKEEEAGGTFEFTPFGASTSPLMKKLFKKFIKRNMKVVEVDSFSVLPKYRGKLGREIVCFMIDYAEMRGYTHAIGIADPSVFRSFNETYKIPCKPVGETFWYKGDYVVPTMFNLQAVYENKQDGKFAWFKKPVELKEKVGV